MATLREARTKYVHIINSKKYFVARQQCQGKPLSRADSKTTAI